MDCWILEGHTPRQVPWNEYSTWRLAGDGMDQRRVARTEENGWTVSTVFLTIDHSFGDGPPVLFETMVFGGDLDESQWRYHTWDEAAAGHEAVVAALRDGVTDADLITVGI